MSHSGKAVLIAGLVLALPRAASAQTAELRVSIINVRNDRGVVSCSLFQSPAGFPQNVRHAIARVHATGTGALRVCVFPHAQAGRLAVSVLHDEDSSGEMNTNVFGVPQEGWGVSNDAPPSAFAPPTFEAASFEFTGKPLQIRLRY